MHRAILEACFPYFLWLLAGFGGLWLLGRVSGARLALARLRALHRSQEGSVQTLSFVLTLPVFMMIVLFIVQVSQLMIGITIVHYAAFAAARAASVWLPAEMPGEPANTLDPVSIDPKRTTYPYWHTQPILFNQLPRGVAWKYHKVHTAAAMACFPISPSKQYLTDEATQQFNEPIAPAVIQLYQTLVPRTVVGKPTASDPVIPKRIRNKAYFAFEQTWVHISGVDFGYNPGSPGMGNSMTGPTYNPLSHPTVPWNQEEIGWQDPITVQVWFRFPLLTGPGRFLSPGHFLSARLNPPDGTPDKVSSRIKVWRKNDNPRYKEDFYWVELTATATITNEGIKSGIPLVQTPE
jgi:hypothetical protein